MMTLNYESNAVEPKDAAVNLYILPYETYEEHIKSDFNLFKRTDALYQYEDKLFSFYSWDKYVSFFNNIKGSVNRKIDEKQELKEALDEKYSYST